MSVNAITLYGQSLALTGHVKMKQGSGILLSIDEDNNAIQVDAYGDHGDGCVAELEFVSPSGGVPSLPGPELEVIVS